MQKHRAALNQIETRFGVPATIVLAIWGRETDYGRYRLPYDAVRVVATQAYVGRRKEQYRTEFILALKILGEGAVTRKEMRSSWAGATGLTQFLPSEYYKHGIDLDGDGRDRHLEFGAGCARLRCPATRQQGLAEAACAGPMRCGRRPMSIAPWACPR